METQWIGLAYGLVYAVIVFAWLWIAKLVADLRTRRVLDAGHQIAEGQNLALALRRSGLYLGLAIGMLGALSGRQGDFTADVVELLIEGATLTVFLFVAQIMTDAVVVHFWPKADID